MSNTIKDLLKVVLTAILPFLFTLITGETPDFPLDVKNFIALIVWFFGLLIGGWQSAIFYFRYFYTKSVADFFNPLKAEKKNE